MNWDAQRFAGAPQEFPPGFREFARHRKAYLDTRREDAERYCAEQTLREALSEICGDAPHDEGER